MTLFPSHAYARGFAAANSRQRSPQLPLEALVAAAGLPTSFNALIPNAA